MKFVVYVVEKKFVICRQDVWEEIVICHSFTRAQEELAKIKVSPSYKRIRSSEVVDLEQ